MIVCVRVSVMRGLKALQRGLAADNPGLRLVTTRTHVADLDSSPNMTRQIDLEITGNSNRFSSPPQK